MSKMPKNDRIKWLAEYIRDNVGSVDILDSDFVDAYTEATGMKYDVMLWGANKCKQLAKDLRFMHRCGYLKRWRTGLGQNWVWGFPKWVYSYELGRNAKYLIKMEE